MSGTARRVESDIVIAAAPTVELQGVPAPSLHSTADSLAGEPLTQT
jgi:hypothetical protein